MNERTNRFVAKSKDVKFITVKEAKRRREQAIRDIEARSTSKTPPEKPDVKKP